MVRSGALTYSSLMHTADASLAASSGTGPFPPARTVRPHHASGRALDLPIVFVLSADVAVRESVTRLVRTVDWVCEFLTSPHDLLSRSGLSVPCCLVLDAVASGADALEVQQQLAGHPEVPVVFVCGTVDVMTAVRAMKRGAFEVLTRPLVQDTFLAALGGAVEQSRDALRLDADMRELRQCYASLTPREREVMALVVSGLLNKQVGGELGISEITVKAHRGQVMRKMKAESLPDLVRKAARLRGGVQKHSPGCTLPPA